jgi:hypothetical protein
MKRLLGFFLCLICGHDWTCNAAQGIPATPLQLANGLRGFLDYATMYCKRCRRVSDLNPQRRDA